MNKPRKNMKNRWSIKYKRSINCNNPKGFSQKNYCKRQSRGGKYVECFRDFIEMASFTLPNSVKIKEKEVSAIDMQFEKIPKTFNKEGMVMNQGSKFIAKIPNKNYYISYDGHGRSTIISDLEAQELANQGYDILPEDWWEKANLL